MRPYRFAELIVVQPVYEEGAGLVSRVHMADGTQTTVCRTPLSLMQAAMRGAGYDWKVYRKAHVTHRREQSVPIVVDGYAYMTCQMVQPAVKKDRVFGYLRVDRIHRVVEAPDGSGRVEMMDGTAFETVRSYKTVLGHYRASIHMQKQDETRRRPDSTYEVATALDHQELRLREVVRSGGYATKATPSAMDALAQDLQTALRYMTRALHRISTDPDME